MLQSPVTFMRIRFSGSDTFDLQDAPEADATLGSRYGGSGARCMMPSEFQLRNCTGLRDLSISGTLDPAGIGPYIPLVQAVGFPEIDTTQVFVAGAAARLKRQPFCNPGTYSAARLRLPSGAVVLGKGVEGNQQSADSGGEPVLTTSLARIQIKDSQGRVLPTAALEAAQECVQPVSVTVELAEGSEPLEEFFIEMWSGAGAGEGQWLQVYHAANLSWPVHLQSFLLDPALAVGLPQPVVSNVIFETSQAQSGSPYQWQLPDNTFTTSKASSVGFFYQATTLGNSQLPPWLVLDPNTRTLVAEDAVSFVGTDETNRLEVEIRVFDPEGDSASMQFFLMVTPSPPTQIRDLPDITLNHLDYLNVDVASSFQVNVRTGVLTFSASPLPPWATFDEQTGLLTGLPGDAGADTSTTITVEAVDPLGETVSGSFTVTVLRGCYEGFQYLRVMAFVASTDSRLRACIEGWDVGVAGRSFLTWTGLDGAQNDVDVEPTKLPTSLGLIYDMGTSCVVPSSFNLGTCNNVQTLKVSTTLLASREHLQGSLTLLPWPCVLNIPRPTPPLNPSCQPSIGLTPSSTSRPTAD